MISPDSWTLHPHLQGLAPSATLAINERSRALEAQGRRIYKLGLGQSPFPVPRPVVEALKRHAGEKDYLAVQGLPALRQVVAEHHQRTYGIGCTADDVIIGPGSKELMFQLQMVCDAELLLPAPSWVSYAPQARLLGRRVEYLPTRFEEGWHLSAETLDAHCRANSGQTNTGRARILILNYPSNPTGTTLRQGELEALAEVARRHRILLLSDEIYGKLHHRGEHTSVVPLYPEGSVWSGGLSKWCGAGGWRLGVFVVPPALHEIRDAMLVAASETFTAVSAPIQYAAVHAFEENEEIETYLKHSRRLLGALGRHLTAALRAAGARVCDPDGGFYLFPDLSPLRSSLERRGIGTSGELCERLLEDKGVAVLPGSHFGRPPEELTLRLAYVNFEGRAALEAVARVPDAELDEAFLRACCANTLEGVEQLCLWLRS